MARTTHFVGRTSSRSRIFVDIELRRPAKSSTTIEHAEAPADALEFSAMGAEIEYRRRRTSRAGQMLDTLADIVEPAPGWSLEDVASLLETWRRWHLNGMRAACAHMDVDELEREDNGYGGTRIMTKAPNVCAESGYIYGHAWLLEILPAEVVAEVERLQALPTGNVH